MGQVTGYGRVNDARTICHPVTFAARTACTPSEITMLAGDDTIASTDVR
jgi:hypothetical protein